MKINLCSGQRPFGEGWANVDVNPRWKPDIVADGSSMPMFADESADIICIHHGLEHFGLGEADSMLNECYRILKPGGALLIFVPDLKALAKRWLLGQIDDYTYCVNLYGAYMGDEADRHKFGYTRDSLERALYLIAPWSNLNSFDFRPIPGADIARDWWILGMEATK